MKKVASSGGVDIALHDLGGDGPNVLVAHCTGFCGRAYQVLADELAESFHLWALDFRGHGASTNRADGDMNWEGFADDIAACIDALGGGPLRVIGHSVGAATTVLAEQRYPGLVAHAWLYEPIAFSRAHIEDRPENPMTGPARRRRADFADRAEVHERYADRLPLSMLHPAALAAYIEHGFVDTDDGVTLACRPEIEARVYESEEAVPLERLAGTPIRAVVANGGLPPVAWLSPPLVDELPDATLQTWPELGHFGPLEAPGDVAPAIKAALG